MEHLPDHDWFDADDSGECSECSPDSPYSADPVTHLEVRLARALALLERDC